MRALTLAVLAAGMMAAAASAPVEAREYRFCLQSPETGIPGDCSYQTYAQCNASASGRRAYCNLNPRYAFSDPERPGRRWHRAYPDY
ncbi:MAG: DUF3551 domain-containing protein [Rhizobiales bacterium]|nr:DUF3551 domain-containing protein [Hyphomicrobiales bacterium]